MNKEKDWKEAMRREEYNACMSQKLQAPEVKKLTDGQPYRFCVSAKLCKGLNLSQAMESCAKTKGIRGHRGKRGEARVKPSEIKPTDAQQSALRVLNKCEITHAHNDGDLTLDCGGYGYMVTTEGRMFKEVRLK